MNRQRLTIIKVGGKIVEESDSMKQLIQQFSQIDGHKILVHGGGRSATKLAEQLGITTTMVDGRRITDLETLRVVTMVYAGWVNKSIVAALQAVGVNALGLSGADMNSIVSIKRPIKEVDYGYVGDVQSVNITLLSQLISQGVVPVMVPITHDGRGSLLNTNADTVAAEVAKALSEIFEVELIYCFEKSGVLSNPDDDQSVIDAIDQLGFEKLRSNGVIQDGMIPKIENALSCIDAGVSRVRITKASDLLLQRGTLIS